jgi:fructose-bisphosphate aldolase class II
VRKINIDTDCRLAITAAVREALIQQPERVWSRFFLKPSIHLYAESLCRSLSTIWYRR